MIIGICDDDAAQAKVAEREIRNALAPVAVEIEIFSSGLDLLSVLDAKEYRPDILVLDIMMPEIDGIETAKQINRALPLCQIIFLTDYLDYAPDVYGARHCYFVLKSQLHDRIASALETAITNLQNRRVIGIRCGRQTVSVATDEILFMERNLRKTDVICVNAVYTTSEKPEDILSEKTVREELVRCHQSYWVNLRHISALSQDTCTMDNGRQLPVSRSHQRMIKDAFHSYLSNCFQ